MGELECNGNWEMAVPFHSMTPELQVRPQHEHANKGFRVPLDFSNVCVVCCEFS